MYSRYACYELPLCLLYTPVMTGQAPTHSRNMIIMFKAIKGQLTRGMGGSDGCRYDALLIVVEY